MRKNHLSMKMWWFHQEIKNINQLIRPLLPDPTIRFDLDSLLWREKVRETLNIFLKYLPQTGKGLEIGCGKGNP